MIRPDYLWYNTSLRMGMPILFPFERKKLLNLAAEKGKSVEFPVGEFWVDKSAHSVIVLDYAFPSEVCAFYDEQHSECSVYDSRPAICRMYPITIFQPFRRPGVGPGVDSFKCLSSVSIFGKVEDEEQGVVVCPPGETFSSIFGTQYQDALMKDLYQMSAILYIDRLMRRGAVKLERLRVNHVSKILNTFRRIEFEDLYTGLEKGNFRSLLKPLLLKKLQQDSDNAEIRGFPGVDLKSVSSWIEAYW